MTPLTAANGEAASTRALPFRQNGDKIVGAGMTGNARFGQSVALSADGNTAVVGGPDDNGGRGAAWVFTRSRAGAWTQQGPKLVPNDGGGQFGSSVALSANGAVALIGGPGDAANKGAVWVFTRSTRIGDAVPWRQSGTKLVGDGGSFGLSVALSADGGTGLIGAPLGQGAAWVYLRAGSLRAGSLTKLTPAPSPSPRHFGRSVAISGDGRTALVGKLPQLPFPSGPDCYSGSTCSGTVEVFTRGRGGWSPSGALSAGSQNDFGGAIAVSADGTTVLVGSQRDRSTASVSEGAARVFVRSGSGWTQQGGNLTTPEASFFGRSVALTPDGNTALIGSPGTNLGRGAIWAFARSGGAWSQLGEKVEAGGEIGGGYLGASVALAADGNSSLVGALLDNNSVGGAWAFVNRPAVVALAPVSAPTAGGTDVTVAGTDFRNAASVRFGSREAASFTVVSPTVIRAVSPAGAPGTVDVTVSNSGGTSAAGSGTKFTYVGPVVPLPPTGDTQAPTTPGTFRGRYLRGSLVLRWQPARDNTRLDHYRLSRNGREIMRLTAEATTASLRNYRPRRAVVFALTAFDAAANRSAAARLNVIPKKRPAVVPRTIPRWAKKLYAWQARGRKGARTVTPKPLPRWYARWRAWRLAPYTIRTRARGTATYAASG